jgi:hypothetical protein
MARYDFQLCVCVWRGVMDGKLVGCNKLHRSGRVAYCAADIGEGGLVGRQWGEPHDLR